MRKYLRIFLLIVLVLFVIFMVLLGYNRIFYGQCATILASSLFLVILTTPISKKIAIRLKMLDYPSKRKVHTTPMPLLGGLSVAASFAFVILVNFQFSLPMKGVILGGGLLFFTGVIDDIKGIPVWIRLVIQLVACLILARCGVMISFLPDTLLGRIGEFLITFVWIVWVINAVNFFDGLDGLASGLVAIASVFFLIVAIQTQQVYFRYLASALIGGCLGFLLYNFYPAEIFLGDGGSSFLGFTLGALAVMGGWSERGPATALSVPLIILGVFVFDMVYITVSRIVKGETKTLKKILEYTGKDHLHHRLLEHGFSQPHAVMFIYLLALCLGFGALVLRTSISLANVFFLYLQAIILFILVSLLLVVRKNIKK